MNPNQEVLVWNGGRWNATMPDHGTSHEAFCYHEQGRT